MKIIKIIENITLILEKITMLIIPLIKISIACYLISFVDDISNFKYRVQKGFNTVKRLF